MILQQVSVHLKDKDMFNRNLRLFAVKKVDTDMMVPLKQTYTDPASSLIELNTVCSAHKLEFQFLFSKNVIHPSQTTKTVHDKI